MTLGDKSIIITYTQLGEEKREYVGGGGRFGHMCLKHTISCPKTHPLLFATPQWVRELEIGRKYGKIL